MKTLSNWFIFCWLAVAVLISNQAIATDHGMTHTVGCVGLDRLP